MHFQNRLVSGAACATLVFCVGIASADEHENKVAAEVLFEQGRSLMATGRYSEACPKFEASHALDAGIGTLLFLADCYEHAGRTASAWATFREAESLARVHNQEERVQIAKARAQALESKISKVIVRVPEDSRVRGLSVRLGTSDIPSASWGIPLPIDPGEQRVEASAPGYRSWQATVHVPRGDALRYAVMIPRLELKARPQEKQRVVPSDSGSGLRTGALVTGATGLAGLGAGAVLTAVAARKNDESLEECPVSPNRCTERGVRLRKEAGNYADAATASFAVGGGLVITGLVLYVAAPREHKREGTTTATAVSVVPTLGSTSLLGLRVRASW